MDEVLRIPFNDEFDIQVGYNREFKEVYTCLVEKGSTMVYQDIAIVRPLGTKQIEALVYADCNDEDYTDKFTIDVWNEEE